MYANILNLSQKEILTLKTLTSVEKRSDTTLSIAVPNTRTTFNFIDKKARDTYFQELNNKANAKSVDEVLAGAMPSPPDDFYVLSPDNNTMLNLSFVTNVTKMNHDSLVFRMEHRSYTFTFGSMMDRDKYFIAIVDLVGAQSIHDVLVNGLNIGFGPGGSPGSPGAQEFLDLDDTPASYTGDGGKLVKVNASEDGLEFGSPDDASSGLERVGDGWRLIGRDPGNFGTPGIDSVDLSSSDGPSSHRGALGRHSLATGDNVSAAGDNSATVGGHTNEATGTNTVVVGGFEQFGKQNNMVYMHGTKYKGYRTSEMNKLRSEKGTILFNTDLNRLVQCIDDVPKPNVWNVIAIDEGSPGMTFEELKDTPAGYAGEKGRMVIVKSTEDGLEFGSPTFISLIDTPDMYGSPGASMVINAVGDGLTEMHKADLAGDPTQMFRVKDGVQPGDAVNYSQISALLGGLHYKGKWPPVTTNFPDEKLKNENTGFFWIVDGTGLGPGVGSPGSPGSPGDPDNPENKRVWYDSNWIVYNGNDPSMNAAWDEYSEGVRKFLDMLDTPSSYLNEAGKVPVVNSAMDGLEFTSIASGSTFNITMTTTFKVGDPVTYDGSWKKASSTDNTTTAHGIVMNIIGTIATIITSGEFNWKGHKLDVQEWYYLAKDGSYTRDRSTTGVEQLMLFTLSHDSVTAFVQDPRYVGVRSSSKTYIVDTITERDAIVGVMQTDRCIVTNDIVADNNGEYVVMETSPTVWRMSSSGNEGIKEPTADGVWMREAIDMGSPSSPKPLVFGWTDRIEGGQY